MAILYKNDGDRFTYRFIMDLIVKHTGVPEEQITDKGKKEPGVIARHLLCYFVTTHTNISLNVLGGKLGRNNCSVLHASRMAQNMLEGNYDKSRHKINWMVAASRIEQELNINGIIQLHKYVNGRRESARYKPDTRKVGELRYRIKYPSRRFIFEGKDEVPGISEREAGVLLDNVEDNDQKESSGDSC
jgi:hypothetical protein